jgi:hypothetical protein
MATVCPNFNSNDVPSPFAMLPSAADMSRQEELDSAQAVAVYRRLEEQESERELGTFDDNLEALSIDDLRLLACRLHVPERSRITEKSELIAEIRRRL